MRRTFRLASQYIALSSALQPGKDTYLASLHVRPAAKPWSQDQFPSTGLCIPHRNLHADAWLSLNAMLKHACNSCRGIMRFCSNSARTLLIRELYLQIS